MSWVTGLDLAQYLRAAKLISSIPADMTEIDRILAAQIARWEKWSGWSPFCATPDLVVDVPLSYKRGKSIYELPSVVLEMEEPASITTTSAGTLLRGVGWDWLSYGFPCTIELYTSMEHGETFTLQNCLLGRVASVPADANEAMLAGCAASFCEAHPELEQNLIQQRLGDVQAMRDSSEGSAVEAWRKVWDRGLKAHRRGMVMF